MAGQAVFAAAAKVPNVGDISAGGNDLDQWAVDAVQRHFAAQRVDLDVSVMHIAQRDGTVEGFNVHVSVGKVADIHGGRGAFHGDIAMQLLGVERSRAGVQGDAGIGRNQ